MQRTKRRTEDVELLEDLIMDAAKILDDTQARFFHDSAFAEFDFSWTQEKFWTSKGNPTGKLKEDISSRVKMCLDGINTILSVGGEFVDQLLAEFKTSGVLAEVLSSLEAKKEAKRQAEAFVRTEGRACRTGSRIDEASCNGEQRSTDDGSAFDERVCSYSSCRSDVPDFMKSIHHSRDSSTGRSLLQVSSCTRFRCTAPKPSTAG